MPRQGLSPKAFWFSSKKGGAEKALNIDLTIGDRKSFG